MPVLSARNLSKTYGPQTLFEGLSLTIRRGERVGLLGVNGTGKSTLLRALAGLEPIDEGIIERRRDATILYLAQEPVLDPSMTPRQIVETGLAEWSEAMRRHGEISARIGAGEHDEALLAEQATLGERIEQLGGWVRGHVVDDMLTKLQVLEPDRPVGDMSGGEKRRVALAHLLVARPMLAILDEPTNHLDADTIAWLEQYLVDEYEGAVLLVTHDRYVLDAVCQRTLELDRGKLVEYQGGYGDYLEQKAERLAHEERAEANRMNILRREKAWLMRGAQARSTKQKARIQRAEALIAAEPVRVGAEVDLASLGVEAPRTGRTILDFIDLDVSIGPRALVRDLTLHLVSGERIGIVGPNGAGKTSLLKTITRELEPSRGQVVVGNQTKLALFDQARAQLVDDWSILDNVAELEGAEKRGAGVVKIGDRTIEMRTYLEMFLFEGSKQRQKVGALSGGERARVALAKILKSGANLLLLDEPTNDLDVATLGSLEELLETWPGSVIVVSHDRWFLDRVATSILAFEGDGRVVRYPGNYTTYRDLRAEAEAKKKEEAAQSASKTADRKDAKPSEADAKSASKPEPGAPKPLSFAEKKELDGLMDVIGAAEARVAELEARLADPALYAKEAALAGKLSGELEGARAEIARLYARWEELEARRDVKR
jgi:ATP-binding cassette subfamily F protein uup